MSNVRKIRVRSKLATFALKAGGVTAAEAVKRAEAAIEDLRGPAIQRIDETVAEIERRFGPAAASRHDEPLEDLYGLSSEIIDVAFAVPNSGVDRAARALCDLVDASLDKKVRDWEAIDVHIEALKLLRAMGENVPAEHREAVLEGLGRVMRKRVGA